jgi:EmrB/QacA subfamily drug resistance transporter
VTTTDTGVIDADVYARRWRILPVLCLSLSIVMIGNASLNIALPVLARELDASASSLQWMVDVYALVFAGLLFTAGTLGDRYGRKGTLQGGLVLFLVGATIATGADSASVVIGARALMGVAAALVMPSTLSILANVFPPHERGRAIAIWAGVAAGGAALGPTTTGFLLEHLWWGSVFLVNVPLVLIALVAGMRVVPKSRNPVEHPFDIAGALLSMLGIGSLVYAIIEAPGHGWTSPRTLVAFVAAALFLGLFWLRERTARSPMLDLRLFRDRRFSVASGGIGLAFFAMFGTFFLITQYMQLVLGHSALAVGVALLPVSITMATVSPQAPKLVARFGNARVASAGLAVVALGLALMATLGTDSSILMVDAAFVPMAAGMAITMTPLTTLIMAAVPPGNAGVGSAMNDTTRELGGALGVAVLGSVVNTTYASELAPHLTGLPVGGAAAAESGLAGALAAAARLPGAAGSELAGAARSAFLNGMSVAVLVAAGIVLLASVAAYVLLPDGAVAHAERGPEPEPADGELQPEAA